MGGGDEAVDKKIKIFIALMIVICIIAVSGCRENVVAEVNGEKITTRELSQQVDQMKVMLEERGMDFSGEQGKELLASLEKEMLNQMINNKLMIQEAKQFASLTAEQVEDKVNEIKGQFASEEEYNNFLIQAGMSGEEAAFVMSLQEELTKDTAPVSEEEAREYYEANEEQFVQPEQFEVRHILFFVDDGSSDYPAKHTDAEAKELAGEVIAQLNQGADFAALAAEKSEDEGTKIDGGRYVFSKGQSVKEFEDAACALNPGEYTSTPVKTDYGYHVIKMEQKIPAGQQAFEQVKEVLMQQLLQQAKQEKFNRFMQDAIDKADIVNNLI
jgi:peptidyl-prolyl cis-trans isomerase C